MRSFTRQLGASLLPSLLLYVPGAPVANAPVKALATKTAQNARLQANPPVNCRPVRARQRSDRMRRGVKGT